jgi:perosamine synthetase
VHIPMSGPDLGEAEFNAVREVLGSGSLSIGRQIEAFERAVANYTGRNFAIGTSSGTSGLHLAIIAAGVKDNDLVITTPFSFIASSNVMLYERAVPIFVDVDPISGNLDPLQVAEAVDAFCAERPGLKHWLPPALRETFSPTAGSLKAILPVHAFGQPAAMEPLLETARRHQLFVIEDACEALGSEHKGRRAGAWGDLAVFAFYPNKQITTGEGGMIVTNRAEWDGLLRSLRNQGRGANGLWLEHSRLGYNYRLDEMSAALGAVQAQRIEELLARRERVAGWYNARLAGNELIEIPCIVPETTRMSWFVYVVRLRPPAAREPIMAALAERGIPTRPYFMPIHLQPFYVERFGYQRGSFPHAEALGDCCLALPFSSVMSEAQVDYVCRQLIALTPEYAGRAQISA